MASPFSRFRHAANRGSMVAIAALLALAGCASPNDGETQTYFPEKDQTGSYNPAPTTARQGVFGGDGLAIFGGGQKKKSEEGGSGGIGVNSFLWRATLDTISFMPLASADPFGGVIITDWYTPPQTPDERFKVTVYILDRALRADGLRVSVFRQVRQGDGWVDQATTPQTATSMENAILQRAREFRMEAEARR
ncbi:MAG TPA: DUF3576 domain-containing protein [Ferrovibrio sp.]|uniref:DUF3576 domain-containing protein n=1 Tax=Ferrovibrio sp. TaxID=1917215 RepID=UPI002B4B7F51|nr:DUF3576 domain-containing protein [Ferrovibrio sp.]HLT76336.1 DUF3576 domain-containing protein [Ferrovibrio sp.]